MENISVVVMYSVTRYPKAGAANNHWEFKGCKLYRGTLEKCHEAAYAFIDALKQDQSIKTIEDLAIVTNLDTNAAIEVIDV